MPIIIAPKNVDLLVLAIHTDEKVKKHLENLGVTISTTLQLLSSENGSVVILVREARYALDSTIASKILVRVK